MSKQNTNGKKRNRKLCIEALDARKLLAANVFGDFNGDGFDDVAVADEHHDIGTRKDAGIVRVTYGSRNGLSGGEAQALTQTVARNAESYDRFGEALAVGDFNKDGYDDLAVGAPGEDVGSLRDAGMVTIFYGSNNGLKTTGVRHIHQNTSGIQGKAEKGDKFGAALAAGDFDNDGYDDLAIGAPEDSVSGKERAGLVNVVFGSSKGLQSRDALISQNTSGVRGVSEKNDYFGSSLAAGDFNGDGRDDLAIGVPKEDFSGLTDAGVVQVLYGTSRGLTTSGDEYYHQNTSGILGTAESGDRFGTELAAGDFNGDGRDDLAIGVPYEDIRSIRDGGQVSVIYGEKSGLGTKDAVFYQGNNGIAGTAESYDRFGFRIATGDVNGDGRDELLIGTPYEDHSGRTDAGALSVIYGSKSGLGTKDVILSQAIDSIAGAAEHKDYFAHDVVFGDFNGDGKDDIAAVVSGENFGALSTPTAINVIYGTTSSLSSAKNRLLVHGYKTPSGLSLTAGDDSETEPVYRPTEVTGSFLSETVDVDIPQEVSGSFLIDFDPHAIAKTGDGDAEAYSYNDIQQQSSASCIFASSLAAVARTDFDFASHIKYAGSDGESYKYKVKLYHHETLKAKWVTVRYDGTRESVDMGYSDKGEFWTALYLRAYANMYKFKLSELAAPQDQDAPDSNALYRTTRTAMQTITGAKADWDDITSNATSQQQKIQKAIASGNAVMAVTMKNPSTTNPSKKDIPKKGSVGNTGLIYGHGYTVLRVDNVGSSSASVTLRNPWGKDNNLSVSQYSDGFSSRSRFEGDRVNSVREDGLIRISWTDFQRYFNGYNIGKV